MARPMKFFSGLTAAVIGMLCFWQFRRRVMPLCVWPSTMRALYAPGFLLV